MIDTKKYEGIIPAFYACYDKDGNINPEGVRDLNPFLKKGLSGVRGRASRPFRCGQSPRPSLRALSL